jgi:TonB family protein
MPLGTFMQRCIVVFRLSVALLVGALCALNLWAADDVQKQLSAEYHNKILALRQPYSGERLQFGADGKLFGDAKVGPWTIDGQVEVKSVTLVDRSLKIQGRRVRLFFDPFRRQFRDIASVSEGDKAASLFKSFRDQQHWKQVLEQSVEIDVELASESPDYKEISLATEAIFQNSSESRADVLPSFWRSYFADNNRELQPESEFHEDLYRAHQDGVSAPTPLLTVDPEYSEAARQAGFEGRVTMSIIVDKDGNPRDIQVVNPAGLGLDEESVNAVLQWKFLPGQKEARPVNVQLSVETSFRLY